MNKKRMSIMTAIMLAGMVWQAQASLFTDNFNRTAVAGTTNGADIGSGYVISSTTATAGKFALNGTQLTGGGGAGSAHIVLSYQGLVASNTAGSSFQASIDVTPSSYSVGLLNGLVFNFQNATNYYYARISAGASLGAGNLSFGQFVDSTAPAAFSGTVSSLNIVTGTVYTLTISSDTAGTFDYTLIGGTLNLSGTFSDTVGGVDFSNGYVGAYAALSNGNPKFDNFSVTVIPEPATIGMMGLGAVAAMLLRRMRTR